MSKKPFLVTGGCGFVGRNLVRRLLKQDSRIWIIDNLFTGRPPESWLPQGYDKQPFKKGIVLYSNKNSQIFFVRADLVEFLQREMLERKSSVLPGFSDVFHLGSVVGGRELIEGDPILVSKDLAIDSTFFQWVTKNKNRADRVMYASSSAAYPVHLQGNKDFVALAEDLIQFDRCLGQPDMTYGWSKLTGEFLSRLAAQRYGLAVCCVRPFSGYGMDQDFSYPIPAIAQRVAKREDPLVVWGTGEQGRDFVYIDDCIEAFFIAIENIRDGSGINIGSGKLTNFLTVLDIFTRLEGYSPKIKKMVDKPVGVLNRYADILRISRLGWKPTVSVEEGFEQVLAAVKDQMI